jgi:antibiotic biosynthesis monooxygenase (ABM) superfamily enzyme
LSNHASSGAIMVFSAEVMPGKEEEFNNWYDDHHIPLFSKKLPGLKNVKRYFSKRANPQFMTIYEFASFEDLKKTLASDELKAAKMDADAQIGVLMKSSNTSLYDQIYPRSAP